MESSGNVTGHLKNLMDSFSQYNSFIDGLTSWKGDSHDHLQSEAESFSSSFSSSLSGQLTAYASACILYSQYATAKSNYEISCDNLSKAQKNGDSSAASKFSTDVTTYSESMSTLKGQILEQLSTAKGTTLEATPINSSISVPSSSSRSTAGLDSNLILSDSGYVFPFERGVDASVTSSIGPRSQPIAGASTNHQGTDIGVPLGTKIYSISDGTVVSAGRESAGDFGNWVHIVNDDGNHVYYGHVSDSSFFSEGDRVKAGDLIALSGNEGNSTGPHLHLEIHDPNGNTLNSENIFQDCWPV